MRGWTKKHSSSSSWVEEISRMGLLRSSATVFYEIFKLSYSLFLTAWFDCMKINFVESRPFFYWAPKIAFITTVMTLLLPRRWDFSMGTYRLVKGCVPRLRLQITKVTLGRVNDLSTRSSITCCLPLISLWVLSRHRRDGIAPHILPAASFAIIMNESYTSIYAITHSV